MLPLVPSKREAPADWEKCRDIDLTATGKKWKIKPLDWGLDHDV